MHRVVRGAVVVGVVWAIFAVVSPAHGVPDYVGGTPPVVAGEELTRPAADPVVLAQETDADRIPITGGDIAGMTVLGLGLVGTGVLLRRRARRPAPA
jgi:hypothetical protein